MSEGAMMPALAARGPAIVVDTNVWLDNYLGFRRGNKAAADFIAAARSHEATLLYPVGALQDVFALLVMELKRAARSAAPDKSLGEKDIQAFRRIAWACIDNMREFATAVGADEADLWLASKYRKLTWDLEDSMVLAAAQRAKADYLVTNDKALIAKATVTALTPQDLTVVLEEG